MRKTITATDGHILTNGEIYGKTIYLADGMDESAFHEITEAEYEATMENQMSDEATTEDYKAELKKWGVDV